MACDPEILKKVPFFALLDEDETAVLAAQVDHKAFAARERIYKRDDPGSHAYVLLSGKVQVTTIDEDQQELVVDEPAPGDFFGFASMLGQTTHQTTAVALEQTECIEVSRDDIEILVERKPHAGMDLLAIISRQFHASQELARSRANRNANEIIEDEETHGERIADSVAQFGGSWTFIITFGAVMSAYALVNIFSGHESLGPLPVHPAQPVSFHAGGDSGAGDHDEPESAGQEGPAAQRVGFRRQSPGRVRNPGAFAQIESAG
jgi:CRP/FNR family transcriptional regulator, cyclic AMP receptor protein